MRIGIIGTGKHGSRYARHIMRDIDQIELAAISRRSDVGREQAAEWGVRFHRDWHDLIDDPGVDAVIAVTPPSLNIEIARSCALAAKPLLLEKPLAVSNEDGEGIVRLFRQNRLPLTVGQTLRYNGVIQALKRSFHQVRSFYAFSASQRLEPSTLLWQQDKEIAGAGVILHTAVHMFDALRYITGREISRVRASMGRVHNASVEDIFTAQLKMENGVLGTVNASKVGKARTGRYEFVGSAGELHADQVHGRLEFISGSHILPIVFDEVPGTIVPFLHDWCLFLAGKAENPVSGEEGLAALKICNACLSSARLDEWVEV